jgi:hypothetical protein
MLLLPALSLAQEAAAQPPFVFAGAAVLLGLAALGVIFTLIARATKARYETMRLLIEKGKELPPELVAPHRPPMSKNMTLADYRGYAIGWGNTFTCLGLGISLASYLSSGNWRAAAWGLIFVFLGIGSFINAAIIHWQIKKQTTTGS